MRYSPKFLKRLSAAKVFWVLLASAVIALCSISFSAELKIVRDIEYAKPGGLSLKGDIYRPDTGERLPALALVHGGGFILGDKDWQQFIPVSKRLAEAGYVVFNINYRLIKQGGRYPNNVADVSCAIRWLKAHAAEFGVDKERVGVVGSSAGGYLALMAGFVPAIPLEPESCPAKDEDGSVKGVVSYFGITDLEYYYETDANGRQVGAALIGKPLKNAEKRYREASPFSNIQGAPPTLLLHGDADKLVPYLQSERLFVAMKKANLDVRLHKFEGAGHGFINDLDGEAETRARLLTIGFFNEHLKNNNDNSASAD